MRLIVDGPAPGAANMRRDLELLEDVMWRGSSGAVRLYGFAPPCLSLGRSQPIDDVDLDACRRDGVEVVRRPTGGRAVLHDAEVTYSVTCAASDPQFGGTVMESCARIHAVIADALATLKVATTAALAGDDSTPPRRPDCFARPAAGELVDRNGDKLVGSAQARRAQALLQHGSVLIEPARAARYLRGGSSAEGISAPEPTGGLNQLLGRQIPPAQVLDALRSAFSGRLWGHPAGSEAPDGNDDDHIELTGGGSRRPLPVGQ